MLVSYHDRFYRQFVIVLAFSGVIYREFVSVQAMLQLTELSEVSDVRAIIYKMVISRGGWY